MASAQSDSSFNLYPSGLDPVKLSAALNITTDCLAALCVF